MRLAAELPNRLFLAGLGLLLAVPMAFMPITSAEPFKVPAETVIVTGAWLLLALAASSFPRLKGSPARNWLWCLLGWLVVSTGLSIHPAASVQYLTTVGTYVLLGFAVLAWLENSDEGKREALVGLLAGLVGIQTVLGYVQRAGVDLAGFGARVAPDSYFAGYMAVLGATTGSRAPIGTLGNVNYLAELLVLACPVLIGWVLGLKGTVRWAAMAALVAPLALVVLTACRAAMLGLIVGLPVAALAVFGLRALDPRLWVAARGGAAALVGGLLVAGAGIALLGRNLVDKVKAIGAGDIDVLQRTVNWQAGIAIWRDHILAGAGLGGFKLLDVEKLRLLHPNGMPTATASSRFYQAHNEPIQTLSELGSVGMFFAVMALSDWGKEVRENATLAPTARFGIVWGVTAVVVASCFGFPFHIPLTALVFVLVIALGLARTTDEPAPAVLRPLGGVAVAVLAVCCIKFGVAPLYQAALDQQIASKAADAGRYKEAADYYERARQENRFKGAIITQQLLALYHDRRFEEMAKLYDANLKEGLGMDAMTIKADGLAELNRNAEAIALYEQVMHYYSPDHPNYRRAASQLGRLRQAATKR